jgi:hypothetical protein
MVGTSEREALLTRRTRTIWRVLLLAVGLAGCGPRVVADPFASSSRAESSVRLTVQNDDFKDATIYAVWEGGARKRIGFAMGKTSTTFVFDWVSHRVEFKADFVAGDSVWVRPIDVAPGDHLNLVILNQG